MAAVWRCGPWRVECDALDGGRIGSISWNGRELLTRPHMPGGIFRTPPREFGEYETRPVFGYDDCWPSLESCMWTDIGCPIRDHGELCWREWELEESDGCLSGVVADREQGWVFRRDISGCDNLLRFDFTCLNIGQRPLPMHWAGHVLIPPSALDGLFLPEFASIRQDYPEKRNLNMRTADAVWSYLRSLPEGVATFLILDDLRSTELRLRMGEIDWHWTLVGLECPALGLWYNRRGFPQPKILARDEFGIEWMSGDICNLEEALRAGDAVILHPGEALQWGMLWNVDWSVSDLSKSAMREFRDDSALAVE